MATFAAFLDELVDFWTVDFLAVFGAFFADLVDFLADLVDFLADLVDFLAELVDFLATLVDDFFYAFLVLSVF